MKYSLFQRLPNAVRGIFWDLSSKLMRIQQPANKYGISDTIAECFIAKDLKFISEHIDLWQGHGFLSDNEATALRNFYKIGIMDLPLVSRIEAHCIPRASGDDSFKKLLQSLETTFGGTVWNSGGNIYLWSIPAGSDHTITVGDEGFVVYKWGNEVPIEDRIYLSSDRYTIVYDKDFT